MTNDTPIQAEDVIPVRSRISWGAIIGGSVLALAVYFLLTLLGAAIGLSINNHVSNQNLAIGAVIWAIAATVICLFLGGFVASQLTTGENKGEGVLYGILVWAVVMGMLLWFMAMGVRSGFNAIVGLANPAANAAANPNADWEAIARQNGATDADIERFRNDVNNAPAAIRNAMRNPNNQQALEANASKAAWYSFGGTLVAMIAAALGGLVGAGPTLRLFTIRVERRGTEFNRRDTYVKS